jgi:hypothetical protein
MMPAARRSAVAEAEALKGKAPETLREEAKKGYQLLDNAGIAYAQPQTAALKTGLDELTATNQYNKIAHSKISGYVDELTQKAAQPQGMTFSELHNLRSAIAKEARGPDASTREAAGKIIGKIDELVSNAPATNPNKVDLTNVYADASRLWKRAALADDVDWIAGKAGRKAASKSGVNPDEANREAFRKVEDKVSKPGAYSPFGDEKSDQRKLLAKIVGGDTGQNVLRGAGAAAGSPVTRSLLAAGAGALGLHTGGLSLPITGLSAGALGGGMVKKGFDRWAASRGQQNIDALLRNITTGSSAAPAYGAATTRNDLAEILAAQTGARAAAARGRE